jgi:predicted ATP-dependent endonuclease of OLD family
MPGEKLPPGPSIILAIEEPELYIHPQLAKLFFDVMHEFSATDQVLYATHSPLFVDAYEYNSIAIVRKDSVDVGTCVRCCDNTAFNDLDDHKIFQGLTRLNPAVNELFFARNVLLVEGSEDQIAVNAYLLNEGKIKNRVEEIDWSIVIAGGKEAIPFFQRVLNAFSIPYTVLHDTDIVTGMPEDVKNKHEKINTTIATLAGSRQVEKFPVKLETSLGLPIKHLNDQYTAHEFFQDNTHLTTEFKDILGKIF